MRAGLHTCSDVVPVRVIGGQLLVAARLDDVHPVGQLNLYTTPRRMGQPHNDVSGLLNMQHMTRCLVQMLYAQELQAAALI